MFNNLKIGLRLFISFAIIQILIIALMLFSIYQLSQIDDDVQLLVKDRFVKTVWTNDMLDNVNLIARSLRNIMLADQSTQQEFIKEERERLQEARKNIDFYMEKLDSSLNTEKGIAQMKIIKEDKNNYSRESDKLIDLINKNDIENAKKLLFTDLRQAQNDYINSTKVIIDLLINLFNEAGQRSIDNVSTANWYLLIMGFIAFVLEVIIGFWITRSITKPINQAVEAAGNIAKGNMNVNLETKSKDETGMLLNSMKVMAGTIAKLVNELNNLGASAVQGRLDSRGNDSIFEGEYKNIVKGINSTLDAVIGPLNVAAEYVDRIAKGDIPPKITDNYNGDFNEIKNNLNQCIDAVGLLVADANTLARAAVEGKLDTRADATRHSGDFRAIVQGVNNTLDAVIGPLNVAAEYVDRIAKGDIPPKITDNYNGDFNEIKNNLNQCIDALNGLIDEMMSTTKLQKEGDIDAFAHTEKYQGIYRNLVAGYNEGMQIHINAILDIINSLNNYAKGDLSKEMRVLPGKQIILTNTINSLRQNILNLITDANMLAGSAVEGKLETRADATIHNGDFRKIVDGVNNMLNSVVAPIDEISTVMSVFATGDLTARILAEYKGDFAKLQNDVNHFADSLGDLILKISDSVQNTASAAHEISSTAESLAAASQEQSAQADEVANAVEAMSRTITENAMSAGRTADVATKNSTMALESGKVVELTVQKMKDIADVVQNSANSIEQLGESSKQIGEIISVIDDIADQTNLLALNAAIEAARAGEQGRGFAVVADEVRKLAERTTEATKQIANMIKGIQSETQQAVVAMNKGTVEVQSGIELADKAGDSLRQILTSTQEVLDMVNQIASASEEQSATSEQISKNVIAISKVTADSTARVEEVAKTADELAQLTEQLRDLVMTFKVDGTNYGYTNSNRMIGSRSGSKQLPSSKY